MAKLDQKKVAITVGIFLGTVHIIWAVLVALGLAQQWINFAQTMHFLSATHTVLSFSVGTALLLIVMASVIGAAVGWLFAALWNWVNKTF